MENDIWHIDSPDSFNDQALRLFRRQVRDCAPYRRFCSALGRTEVDDVRDIPFLPITAFKHHEVRSVDSPTSLTFESSGTTGDQTSRHHLSNTAIYEQSFIRHFEQRYGPCADLCILALLPSYLERVNSSLVYMADRLMKRSAHAENGFFLNDHSALTQRLERLEKAGQDSILIGVSFALLDLIEHTPLDFPDLIVMETGGMKGRREELIREELHRRLKDGFGVEQIHSEYGMTELLSQAYSSAEGRFHCPPWMRLIGRQTDDPLSMAEPGRTCGLNIIDLANEESCAFIATDDLGQVYGDGSFEVLGRFDRSDVRGCSLMVG